MDYENEDINVSDDHLLLSDIVAKNKITVKDLVFVTGFAGNTIYKYLGGMRTIPTVIWRAVYRMTGDPRIIQLLTGDVPQVIVPLPVISTSSSR